ncbi:Nonribosomal peptide synthetase dtxS1 [Cladobotryum mycophilum]|uniref:Nonribosomal peptide synthetase dtxS1 n=1 Tax=Cladobotryum mycophilum TaxID=491253 RepID=A0ABR0SH26_9HYPO
MSFNNDNHRRSHHISLTPTNGVQESIYSVAQPSDIPRTLQNENGAVDYWHNIFEGCESVPFPALLASVESPTPDKEVECGLQVLQGHSQDITLSTKIFSAWALITGQITSSNDVVFGAVVDSTETTADSTIPTVPIRIKLSPDQTIGESLQNVQQQVTDMAPFEHTGLQEIAKSCPEAERACMFQTLFAIYPQGNDAWQNPRRNQWAKKHSLIHEIYLGVDELKVVSSFDSRVISPWMVEQLLQRLEFVIRQLDTLDSAESIGNVHMVTDSDLEEIWTRNELVPQEIDRSLPEMVEERAQLQPGAPAISAWDGELTYGELDRLSSLLANRLASVHFTFGPDRLIPLCFDKSKWTSVTMLGVLKAGAAFVLLDPSLPEQRLQAIVRQVDATIILASSSNASLSSRLAQEVLTIDSDFFAQLNDQPHRRLPSPNPSSTMYAVFTSGSTGNPKGVTITHRNHASALHYQTEKMGLTSKSRIYDFSAYSFDLSIFNTFSALALGGCLCVPNEKDRRDRLTESIASSRATWIYLTPTVARQLVPDKLPDLESLILIGEAVYSRDLAAWSGKVRAMNTYGPSECTTASTINSTASTLDEATRIGRGAGMNTWIVDPENHDSLTPLACVGELLLEGPLVGNGYLSEPEKTAAAFINDPTWLLRGSPSKPGRQGRLYKTGDLVRYNEDGSLSFVGRKDTQVKIRGNRVELGEIEIRIQECIPEATQVVVEVVLQNSSQVLVAFLKMGSELHDANNTGLTTPTVFPVSADVRTKLATHLPSYMVPTVFFAMQEIPATATGKTDRKQLRDIGASLSLQKLAEMQTVGPKRQPTSEIEKQIQRLWSELLYIEQDTIGLDDSFFQLGGDSVIAMKLVAEARKIGLQLTVADIFRQPVLQDVASQSVLIVDHSKLEQNTVPFALLGEDVNIAVLTQELSVQYQVDSTAIEDVYPCTPLQEGLLSLSSKSGDYIMRGVVELSSDVDIATFRNSWEEVARTVPILRTRIAQYKDLGLLQMVVNEKIAWLYASEGLDKYLDTDKQLSMDIGESLTRYALVTDDSGKTKWFVWTMHHALFDEWSLSLLLDRVGKVYEGKAVEPAQDFRPFIKYIKDQDMEEISGYWRTTMADCEAALFPTLPASVEQPVTDSVIEHPLPSPQLQQRASNITTSTIIRAAWSLLAARMTNSEDVVFGATVSGRSAPVAGIDSLPAPTIATVPVRVKIPSGEQKISEFLEAVQTQATELIPFEQMGLHRIAKVSSDAEHACGFQTLLVIQPNDNDNTQNVLGKWQLGNEQQSFNTYALILEIQLKADSITARASFDSRVIKPWMVKTVLERLEFVMQQLGDSERRLGQVEVTTSQDLKQIWEWNNTVPPACERSIQDVIKQRAQTQPSAPAVCAWDGELTYSELEKLATILADRLVDLGVGPEVLVPLHFEKSVWTTVAILAVLKAGGGFVLLDPSLPEQRLREIIRQIEAKLMLSSSSTQSISSRLVDQVIAVNSKLFAGQEPKSQDLNKTDPSSIAYVIFTSGSTGVPKGVMVTHRNVASAVPEHIKKMGYTADSRIYDFASYSFGAAINNVFAALISGACLCVPSDNDRRSNLADSLASLRATVALLTPSLAESLSPKKVPTLRSIIFGGEAVRMKDVIPWWGQVKVITAYGSSEVTTVSTVNPDASTPEEVPRIGKGAGGATWVVDPDNHDILLPPGCIGELVLEGPLVSRGYLNDPKKTASVFIENPPWLLRGTVDRPGRPGRVYKMGDLVQYNEDGSLSYVGRKDAQVKIRGQRVELGEVETQVQQYLPDAKQAVAEVIIPQGDRPSPTLVVFIQPKDSADISDEVKLVQISSKVEEKLAEYLPSYMMPSVFLMIRELPMTATGKMNRKQLREIGGTFSMQQLVQIQTAGRGEKRQPATELEQKIQRIWSQVLNVDLEMIGLDDSFFQLGGDSITAMQVVSSARSLSIRIRVADIMREKTIFRIAKVISTADQVGGLQQQSLQKIDHGSPQLSPIQRLYFHLQQDPTTCFDQFFYLKLHKSVNHESLSKALETIVRRHDVLRARFGQNELGVWEQRISDSASDSFVLQSKDSVTSEMDSEAIAECRGHLNIRSGPILSAVHLSNAVNDQTLFLTVHHLVVDLVSWRVILRELEDLLTNGTIASPPPSVDFLLWSTMQAQYSSEKLEADTSISFNAQEHLSYWGMSDLSSNVRGGIVVKEFVIDESISSMILGSCNDAMKTRPLELMISALAYSFSRVFSDRTLPAVFTEGHGREAWDENIDVSATVGWFSTIFPVQVAAGKSVSLKEIIRQSKDSLRSLPNNGWPYFTSRFAGEANSSKFSKEFPVEIMFNYVGLYQQLERSDSLFEQISLPGKCDPQSSLDVQRFALFDIDTRVDRGRIISSIEFHKDMHHQDKILNWISEFEAAIGQVAKELSGMSPDWTLSDFPLAFESYDAIREFRETNLVELKIKPEDVEDIFPCAPLQEGIMIAQAKESTNYQRWFELEVQVSGEQARLEEVRLETAWKTVVKRHQLLRALLFDHFPGSGKMMQVILKDPIPSISWVEKEEAVVVKGLQKHDLQHHLTIYKLDDRTARLRFEMNHAITDGFSQDILCHDLQEAYSDSLLGVAGSYKDFVNYLHEQPHTKSREFWTQSLIDVEPCHLPTSAVAGNATPGELVKVPHINTTKIRELCAAWDVTPATVVQVAWALVLKVYTGAAVPCFGNLLSGRDVPIHGIDDTFGPFIGLVPCRIRLDQSSSVVHTLREAQNDYLATLPYQHVPLAEIQRAMGLGSQALFNTLLSFQRVDDYDTSNKTGLVVKEVASYDPTEYDVTIDIMDGKETMDIHLNFRQDSLTLKEVTRLASCISAAISEITLKPNKPIEELSLLGTSDLEQLQEWNAIVPETADRLIHEIIEERARSQPEAPAVCSWDGELNYGEMDQLANGLASRLVELGVGPEMLVPLCFEKSVWTPVSMLAVLKAGGAFVLLDTSLPEQRLQTIVEQIGAQIILSSVRNLALGSRLCEKVVQVSADSINPTASTVDRPPQSSSTAMFAVFTSGSTGTPKGVVLTHANFSSSMHHQTELLGFNRESRVFDFASYAFDIAAHNAIAAFVTGGCLCIPSDADRKNNIAGVINAMRVTVADLTPSVARLLDPATVPDLKTLILAGEAVVVDDASRWSDKVHVINAYGPAECNISTINANAASPEEVVHIGRGAGLLTWIVDPTNHNSLVPIGCTGELLLEGPLIGRGYINELEKTAAVFVENPEWLAQFGRRGRFYKTGDLVRYAKDGNLIFLGRKDEQVKIRGQRVELGEVEHHVQKCFSESQQIAAEVISPGGTKILAAFIQTESSATDEESSSPVKLLPLTAEIRDTLTKGLPQYMIPTLFFAMQELPMTATGKVNRRSLRELGSSFSAQQIADMQTTTNSLKRQPTTETEKLMQTIWANVLRIRADTIGLDDSFFQFGGDSIGAMMVVAEARRVGLQLAVADIFHQVTLQNVSKQSINVKSDSLRRISPFSLLGDDVDVDSLIQSISSQYHLNATIEDIYPCTPFQEGLFSLSLKRSGDYVLQTTLQLSPDIATDAFRKAWEVVVSALPILRTRIIQTSQGLQQVVLNEGIEWVEATEPEVYLQNDRLDPMDIGKPLARYALIENDEGTCRWFVWTVHHVLYDGWSMPLVLDAVNRVYQGQTLEPTPQFQAFINYINEKDDKQVLDYWKNTFKGNESAPFPSLPPSIEQPFADMALDHPLPHPQHQTQNVTTSTLLRAAWALVARGMTNSDDVVFGVTTSGRTAPVTGIERLLAPTIATVPVRVKFTGGQKVTNFLQMVQQQATEMIPFEHTGLHRIAQASSDSQQACNFQTLLVVQPQQSNAKYPLGQWWDGDQYRWFNTYGLVLLFQITSKNIVAKASFDSRIIDPWTVRQLLQRLEYTMFQLDSAPLDLALSGIEMVTPADLKQMWEWNGTLPTAADKFVHEMIAEKVEAQPDAPAICAWDGDFTYKELDQLSSKLALHLFEMGARPKMFVPIFFEKSKWTTVAMMAVMKSSASFVLLDTSLPMQRLEAIVEEVEATIILSSSLNQTVSSKLCANVVTIDAAFFAKLGAEAVESLPPSPGLDSVNYVVFTSGTTGKPKGAIIKHRSSASAVKHLAKGFRYTPESRVYDFSTYSFDGAHFNAFTVLAAGGCLCVPSDQDRKNSLAESMESLRSNTVFLTPTVAELLSPAQVPHLQAMIMGGEAIHVKDIQPWWDADGVRILTVYGPSECTPISMINAFPASPEAAVGIGKGYGVATWVVDPEDHDSLVPLGSVGELILEGPLVGAGYMNDPTKTAAVFIDDPAWLLQGIPTVQAGRNGRLYKTGDLVRYNEDGSLVFVGRKDAQVKIRGQRVELGDVEHQVQECMPESTRVAAEIIVPTGDHSSPMLVAFLEIDNESTRDDSDDESTAKILPIPVDVEDKLAKNLPSYMIPTIFFVMRVLPIGTTGKMNRKRLREIGSSFSTQQLAEMRTAGEGPKRQPVSETEQQLQKLWAQVLDIEPISMIGLDDSFFKLGGNSITAMKIVGEARKLGLQLAVADIFRYPRLHQVAKHAVSLKGNAAIQTIMQNKLNGPVEQSFAQGRLWFLEQLYPGLTWYLMPCVMRLQGPLQLDALNAALLALERRHETLRTVFFTQNGVSMQEVLPVRTETELSIIEMSPDDKETLAEALHRDETTPFDLEHEPGWRTVLYRLGEDEHILSIVIHHIVSDGWSVDILRKELALFYSAAIRGVEDPLSEVDPLPVQYRDFSVWEKMQATEHEGQLEYWTAQLETSQPAEMICDKPRPAALSGDADVQTFHITGELYQSLQSFCQERNVTPFIALLAAFRATHYRLTGQGDATIGSPNANRDQWEVRDTIGFFVNMQCLRIKIEEEALSFNDLVKQVQDVTIASFSNQEVPFERIVSQLRHDRDLSRHPLVQLVFAVHSQLDLGQFTLEGLKTEYIDQSITSRFDLECHFFQERDGLRGEILYSTDLYVPETISNLLTVLEELLRGVLRDPSASIASLPLLTDDSNAALSAMGLLEIERTDYPRDLNIIQVFRQQVAAFPDNTAVKDHLSELTYAQLDQKSDVVAHWLTQRSFEPETLISVYSDRSCQVIVAYLGILKANLAYLPFDSKIPVSRMEGILASIEGSGLVLLGPGVKPLRSKGILRANSAAIPSPTSLAYVMFTSGSTGRPKGVMIEHRSIVRLVKDTNISRHLTTATIAHISNIAFDASTWEIYVALLNGGTLICIDTMTVLDYAAMGKIFAREQIKAMFITPALLKQYIAECPAAIGVLDTIYIGGERLDIQDAFAARALMSPGSTVVNVYGPTENTSFSTFYPLPPGDSCLNGAPIGRPLSNSGALVMDSQQRLVPLGVVGELVVTGDGLARGYTDPQRNVDRFINITLGGETQIRAYRTGDYVRYRPSDGQIEYFGRIDGQVKVRGQRVELGEIEYVMRNHKHVDDAAAVLQQEEGHDIQLVGFVTLRKIDYKDQAEGLDEQGDDDVAKQVNSWEELFDQDTYSSFDNVQSDKIGRDFIGWTSMYDGSNIDTGEMNEWLDDTMKTIINGSKSLNVLELGSGSGMILFNLIPVLNSYVGLDPAQKAVSLINRSAKSIPGLDKKIQMHKGTAADIAHLGPMLPNLVITNSVAQYFPSLEYLSQVIRDAVQLDSVTTLYFGDMRSYALYKEFQVTKALFRSGDKASKDDIRYIMSETEQGEMEFLVDPAFFTSLPTQFPGLIDHVEIIPKRMRATNELSCYRYAAVVHVQRDGPKKQIRKVGEGEWIDFAATQLDRTSLLELLQTSAATIAVCNIPYNKTILERHIIDALGDRNADENNWLAETTDKALKCPSLAPIDLEALAQQTGYRVEISWARQYSQRGGFDAIFHRYESGDDSRVLFQFPTDHEGRLGPSLSSQPLQQQVKQKIREQLQEKLKSQLPSYMIPKVLTFLDKMPVNDNGKVDRRALTENMQRRTAGRGSLRQPTTEAERMMQKIWAKVLNLSPATIGLDDSFFTIGGDSLAAMKIVGESRKAGLRLAVADIFRGSSLQEVAGQVTTADETSSSIPKTQIEGPVEQSFAQGRLWFLEQLYPGLTWYLMPNAIRLRGPLNLDALKITLEAIENRHETLRTTFESINSVEVQVVQPFQPRDVAVIDVLDEAALTQALHTDQTTPIDLLLEPGWRVAIYRVGGDNQSHVLSIVMHHAISDGWSVDILRKELATFYGAAIRKQDPLSKVDPLPIQYRDFSVWQKSPGQIEEHKRQLGYWVKQLETSQPAEFLCDKPRPATLSGQAAVRSLRIEGSIYDQLQKFCRTYSFTPFIVLLAAFRATHFRLTGQTDGNIGTVNANRDRWEVKDMIGFFVNMQSIRIQVEGESFEELVRQVHKTTTDSFANQDVPFENIVSRLQKDRDLSRHPLSQLVFAVHSQMDLGDFTLEGLDTEPIAVPPTTRFDMEVHFFQEQKALQGEVLFSTDLYTPETITNMLSVFHRILEQALGNPKMPIVSLPLLTDENHSALVEMGLVDINQTDYPRESSIVDLFREQVTLYPNRTAVKDSSPSQLTYAELDQQSDAIAKWLTKYSFAPETLVGVFSKRSCQSVLAFMGILKANLAYLPFDLKIPQTRMENILSSLPGRKVILVGSEAEPPAVQMEDVEFVRISDVLEEHAKQNHDLQELHAPSPSSLAYVMFTSGSTGKPKGVMIDHRGIVRLVRESNMAKHLPAAVTMAHLTNIAFDVSAWEMYGALLNGGTLICIETMMLLDPRALSDVFIQEKIQSAIFTPAILKTLLEQAPAAISPLEALYVAGDKADAEDLSTSRNIMKGNAVVNAYGPTENSVISTVYALPDEEKCTNGVPIGQAISNSGAYVMDTQQRLVPLGVVGELVVTGDGLARGYTDPQRNIDRFVTVTIKGKQVKAYRTGDYVRRRPTDGEIEFFGRIDGQIKIRGHRVELGEIEHALRTHNAVNDAIAVLQREEGRAPQIAGFVTVGENLDSNQGQDNNATEHVEVWEELFDAETYQAVDQVQPEKVGRDFIGWASMYDGSDIDKGEMNEWLDETIKTILNGGEPRRVLELGTGTGMILFNLLDGLVHYTGFEPSSRAVEFVMKTAKSISTLSDKVEMYKGTAADVGKLPSSVAPNLVIINSVAQYFPSQEYLFKVVEDIIELGSVDTIFFGDVRSHALYKEFRASKVLFNVGGAAVSKGEVRQKMTELERTELELLVDPAFFTTLPSRLPQIEHVEILSKKMKATNELSSYRYAAVLHIKSKSQHSQPRQIHEVSDDSWIDYTKQGMDKSSLLQLLQSSSPELVAINNIPYSKTIFERFALELLDNDVDRRDWIFTARQLAQKCASMSPVDLVELADSTGFRVEISWARQYSQRGGLDAIFHRYQPAGNENGRVLFKFPTEHHGRPSHSLTSRPLRQQLNQRIQENLYQMLQSQLPPYMVPQVITILEKMPVNDNGKVDRKALAARVQTRAIARGTTRKLNTNTEREMQRIWAQVLNIDASVIGLDDSFFHLGGNSITAMKVVAEVRRLGLKLVVADVFRYDTLEQLAGRCVKPSQNDKELEQVVLVGPATKTILLEEIDSLDLDIQSAAVADILPLTSFQEKAVVDGITVSQHANYFYFDLGMELDVPKFKASCAMTFGKFPILRARFLELQGKFWQVILHNKPELLPVHLQEVDEDLDQASNTFCTKDLHEMSSTELPAAFVLLQHKTQGTRLILRLSHAQYDGISFPIIFQSLMNGYTDVELPSGPDFSRFLSYSSLQQGSSIKYWKKLLKGSSPTPVEPKLRPRDNSPEDSKPRRIYENAEIDLPRLPDKITSATLVSAAWAVLLSRVTGENDVVYGNVVAGRNSAFQGVDEVVGACLNIIPVRVAPSSFQTPNQLLFSVQEQFLSLREADSLGFKDIIEHCTEWPAGSTFDAVIQHQNIDEHPEIDSVQGSSRVQFFENPDLVPPSLFMASYPKGNRMEIKLFANTRIITAEAAHAMLHDLCNIIGELGNHLDKSLQSLLDGVDLGVDKVL